MKIRVKHGQVPGDVGTGVKIEMWERRHPNRNRAKSFRKMVRMKERAVLKERTRREIERELGEPAILGAPAVRSGARSNGNQ